MNKNYLMNNYGARDLSLVKGEGRWVWDDQGNRYLDAVMGIAVCGLGHSHPEVTEVISAQAGKLMHCSNLFFIQEQQQLAEKLGKISGMDSMFFSNSGAEANEAALKLSRLFAREKGIEKPTVIVMENAFHGRTLGTLSASWGKKVTAGFEPLVESFVQVPFNDLEAVAALSSDPSVVAILVEPVQGEAGVNIPAEDYLSGLRKICDANEWLLMLDEIQTGNGRTGAHFCCIKQQVVPDVITTAKGLGNGVPIGVCMASGKAAELFAPGSHGSTYGGNPLVCAVASKVFDIIQRDDLANNATRLGNNIRQALSARLMHLPHVLDVRNSGLLIAIELSDDCGELVELARQHGLIINVTGGNRIRLVPALNMSDEEAELLLEKLCPLVENWKR